MEDISKQEKEFLRKVYCKANYLEYEKRQQALVKENERRIRNEKIRNNAVIGSVLILVVLASYMKYFDTFTALCSLAFLMLVVSYYELKLNMR
jgi:hypothetical protein